VKVVQRSVNKPDKSRAIRGLSSGGGGDEHSFGKKTPRQLLNIDVSVYGLQTLNIETSGSSETSENIYQYTRRHPWRKLFNVYIFATILVCKTRIDSTRYIVHTPTPKYDAATAKVKTH